MPGAIYIEWDEFMSMDSQALSDFYCVQQERYTQETNQMDTFLTTRYNTKISLTELELYYPIKHELISAIPETTICTDFVPRYHHWQEHPCAICLGDFIEGQIATSLPCGHYYHHMCFLQHIWIDLQMLCPQCKTPVTTQWQIQAANVEDFVHEHTEIDYNSLCAHLRTDEWMRIDEGMHYISPYAQKAIRIALTLVLGAPDEAIRVYLLEIAAKICDTERILKEEGCKDASTFKEALKEILMECIQENVVPHGTVPPTAGIPLTEEQAHVMVNSVTGILSPPISANAREWRREFLLDALLECDDLRLGNEWEELLEEAEMDDGEQLEVEEDSKEAEEEHWLMAGG